MTYLSEILWLILIHCVGLYCYYGNVFSHLFGTEAAKAPIVLFFFTFARRDCILLSSFQFTNLFIPLVLFYKYIAMVLALPPLRLKYSLLIFYFWCIRVDISKFIHYRLTVVLESDK